MGIRSYNIEGLKIEIEVTEADSAESGRRETAYLFKTIRDMAGMSRKEFSEWLGIPYRTMQEWELGRRAMPEYVLRLIAYKVFNERRKKLSAVNSNK